MKGIAASLYTVSYDIRSAVDRVLEVFPDCRVMLVVRQQNDAIFSWYRHNIRQGMTLNVHDYLSEASLINQQSFNWFRPLIHVR